MEEVNRRPTIRELAEALRVSVGTIQKTVAWRTRERRSGSSVSPIPITAPMEANLEDGREKAPDDEPLTWDSLWRYILLVGEAHGDMLGELPRDEKDRLVELAARAFTQLDDPRYDDPERVILQAIRQIRAARRRPGRS
jgi:hypothetical protein